MESRKYDYPSPVSLNYIVTINIIDSMEQNPFERSTSSSSSKSSEFYDIRKFITVPCYYARSAVD
jgi:hypothetical protein